MLILDNAHSHPIRNLLDREHRGFKLLNGITKKQLLMKKVLWLIDKKNTINNKSMEQNEKHFIYEGNTERNKLEREGKEIK